MEVTGTGPPEIQVTTFSLFAQLRIPFLQPASGILHQGPSGIQEFHRPANIIGYYISIQYYTIINHSWISPFLMTFNMIESFEPPKREQNYTCGYRTVTHPLKNSNKFWVPQLWTNMTNAFWNVSAPSGREPPPFSPFSGNRPSPGRRHNGIWRGGWEKLRPWSGPPRGENPDPRNLIFFDREC